VRYSSSRSPPGSQAERGKRQIPARRPSKAERGSVSSTPSPRSEAAIQRTRESGPANLFLLVIVKSGVYGARPRAFSSRLRIYTDGNPAKKGSRAQGNYGY